MVWIKNHHCKGLRANDNNRTLELHYY
uniref:Uncharacterized protein n=1 Tax=Rhizophora mucronata TaxID=61149 RepID=A0A2P2P979_RHIMU